MKLRREEEEKKEGLKLGIVRLGRAAGKTKYCLLDERDIELVHKYTFQGKLEVDRNGDGGRVYAYAYIYEQGRSSGQYVHNIIWQRYCGVVGEGMKVVHKNCITVDNRLENLILVPLAIGDRWCSHPNHSFSTKPGAPGFDIEGSLYWAAILQLPYDPLDEYTESVVVRTCNQDGVITEEEDDSQCYYECRFGPCIAVEKDLREFSICGRCQEARYCGAACQQRDWSNHKRVCREKRRAFPLIFTEAEPDR